MVTLPKIHIMLIGPVTNASKGLIGGATISFGHMIRYLDQHNIPYTLVNTKYFPNGIGRILNPFYTFAKVLLLLPGTDVLFLNSSRGGTKYLAPLLYLIARWTKKKFVFRPFGGNIKNYTSSYGRLEKWLFKHTTLRADILFLQTKELTAFYKHKSARVVHLPTSREAPPRTLLRGPSPFRKRFVYLGMVHSDKGIDCILEAARESGRETTIHILGPVLDKVLLEKFNDQPGIYQGVVAPEKLWHTLRHYDVLVLPTYYEGEGYPGAIIEAYALGLPVIATRWKAIPEIVVHQQTGMLIEPQSTDALVGAMRYFNHDNYPGFSRRALDYFEQHFRSETINTRAIRQIQSLFVPDKSKTREIESI